VVGDLWGTLEVSFALALENVGPGGALLQSNASLPPDSVHRLTFSIDGSDFTADAKVRHVQQIEDGIGAGGFLIGFEFLTAHPALFERLNGLAASGGEAMEV
jgi:hypothetical protein